MLDVLLITDEEVSLDTLQSRLTSLGWKVGQPRPDRLVISKADAGPGEYVAIEEVDDSRQDFDEDEWECVIARIASPRIFYVNYLHRQLVREVLSGIASSGILV